MPTGTRVTTLEPGQLIGRYRVIEFLGAGGMGQVYRAYDPSLQRDVALKVIAAPASVEPEWIRLFEQEARGVAAISHPNVVAIYDVIADAERACIVFELLDGGPLRERLQQRNVTPPKAVEYAIQIADGLTAIHAKGMIHRDLKPENVFVTRGDLVKILDFGIAKIRDDAAADRSASRKAETDGESAGDAAYGWGTTGYMSPEQLKGEPVDSRSDVFSFGLILYEMLARRRAFEGNTASVITGILTQDPPLLPKVVPVGLRRIVQRCLEKRPDQRFHSAHDLSLALRLVSTETDTPIGGRRLAWAAAGLATMAAVVIGTWIAARQRQPTRPDVVHMEPETVPLTSTPGLEFQPALSRDGSRVAFVWNGGEAGDNYDIYAKSVDRQTTFRVTTDPANECCPAWSPDGKTIAFLRIRASDAQLVTVPAIGGTERVITAVRPWFGSGVTWSPDGKTLAVSDGAPEQPLEIVLIDLGTGTKRALTKPAAPTAGDGFPAFSPDGTQVAFIRLPERDAFQVAEIHVVDVEGGTERRILRESSILGGLDWMPSGDELVFSASATGSGVRLWRVTVADGTKRPVDDGTPLANVTGAEALGAVSRSWRVSVAAAAHRLAFARGQYDTDIWSVGPARSSTAYTKLISSTRLDEAPQYSPDGRRIAFTSNRNSPRNQIWVCDADGTNCGQITSLATSCGTPRWSPDGRTIAFDAAPEVQTDIYLLDVESRTVSRLTTAPYHEAVPSWSHDGQHVYATSDRTGDWQVWKFAVDGRGEEQVTRDGGYTAFEGRDGRTIFYTKEGAPGLFSRTPDGRETRVTDLPQCKGYWALVPDGVYVVDSNADRGPTLNLFRFATGRLQLAGSLPGGVACGETGLAATPDGKSLAYVGVTRGSDLMLIDNFR